MATVGGWVSNVPPSIPRIRAKERRDADQGTGSCAWSSHVGSPWCRERSVCVLALREDIALLLLVQEYFFTRRLNEPVPPTPL